MNSYRCFLKVRDISFINIYKLLRITINQGEPTALYLYHQAMSFLKNMGNIRQIEFYFFNFVGSKCCWILKTIPEFTSHNFTANQHLITTHWVTTTTGTTLLCSCTGKTKI